MINNKRLKYVKKIFSIITNFFKKLNNMIKFKYAKVKHSQNSTEILTNTNGELNAIT